MDIDRLLKGTWQDTIDNLQDVNYVGAKQQIQSVMLVPAKCAIEVSEALDKSSSAIRNFDASTTRLTAQLIRLNKLLIAATIVGALATGVGAVATVGLVVIGVISALR